MLTLFARINAPTKAHSTAQEPIWMRMLGRARSRYESATSAVVVRHRVLQITLSAHMRRLGFEVRRHVGSTAPATVLKRWSTT